MDPKCKVQPQSGTGELELQREEKMEVETKFSLLSFEVNVRRNLPNASGNVATDVDETDLETRVLSQVLELATSAAKQLVETAKSISPLKLETTNTNVSPIYTWSRDNRQNMLTGYKAEIGIIIKVFNNQTEEAITALLQSGRPFVFLNSLQFEASEESKREAERQLKTKALSALKEERDFVLDQWGICFKSWKKIDMAAERQASPVVRMFESLPVMSARSVAQSIPVVAGVESVKVTLSAVAAIDKCSHDKFDFGARAEMDQSSL
jgi:uncharacterized protein YggE